MKILLLNQFYPPDVAPTGCFLHDLAREMTGLGHQVQVWPSRRSYDGGECYAGTETIDRVAVRRIPALGFGRRSHWGKLADYASFYGCLGAKLLFARDRPDVILCMTTPPYLGLLGRLACLLRGGAARALGAGPLSRCHARPRDAGRPDGTAGDPRFECVDSLAVWGEPGWYWRWGR